METQYIDESFIKVSDGNYLMTDIGAAVLVGDQKFDKPSLFPIKLQGFFDKVTFDNIEKDLGIVRNGEDNLFPVNLKEIAEKNPVVQACINHIVELLYGSGIKYGIKDATGKLIEQTNDEAINEFFYVNNINQFFDEFITDFVWFNKSFAEIITDNSQDRKIVLLNSLEYVYSRLQEANPATGEIDNLYYSSLWNNNGVDLSMGDTLKSAITKIPYLAQKNPYLDFERRTGRRPDLDGNTKDEGVNKYAFCVEGVTPGHQYYPRASWWSVIEAWLPLGNAIPTFKNSLMANQMTLKYLVKINKDYFPEIFAKEGIKLKEDQEKRIKKEFADIKAFLSNVENTGKSFITFFRSTPDGKTEISNIQIEVLENKFGKGEFLEDSHEVSSMIYTAFNVHPSLIGIIPGKVSTSLSGSDKRELLRIAQTFTKRKRDKFLSILYFIKRVNKWNPKVEFWFEDVILTTLDQGREIQTMNQFDNTNANPV